MAWGEKGCSGKKPDVFSDVSTALGFIDWATKCVEGQDVDLFGLSYFKRWAKRQYCINKGYIEDIKTQVNDRLVFHQETAMKILLFRK